VPARAGVSDQEFWCLEGGVVAAHYARREMSGFVESFGNDCLLDERDERE
jgi:hypothetical protein